MSAAGLFDVLRVPEVHIVGGRRTKPFVVQRVQVQADGSLECLAEDDYYSGTIGQAEAVRLARLILERAGQR